MQPQPKQEQLILLLPVCSSSRGWMMAAVLQLSVVRSILFFVLLLLWTDEKYDYGDVSGFGWLRCSHARNDPIPRCDSQI